MYVFSFVPQKSLVRVNIVTISQLRKLSTELKIFLAALSASDTDGFVDKPPFSLSSLRSDL